MIRRVTCSLRRSENATLAFDVLQRRVGENCFVTRVLVIAGGSSFRRSVTTKAIPVATTRRVTRTGGPKRLNTGGLSLRGARSRVAEEALAELRFDSARAQPRLG